MKLFSNSFIDQLRRCDADKILLCERKRELTAEMLHHDSNILATALSKSGIKRGDRVLMALPPGSDFLKIIYANMLLRTLVAVIDPEMGQENYLSKLKQFNPQHLFADSRLLVISEQPVIRFLALQLRKPIPFLHQIPQCNLFATGPVMPVFNKHIHIRALLKQNFPLATPEKADESGEFLLIYTSGTLSEPKGVVHSFHSLAGSINHLSELLKQNNDQAIATHLPHFLLLGINAGLRVYLWKNELHPAKKIDFILRNGITTLFGPPSDFAPLFNYLENGKEHLPECIRNIYFGSAPVYSSFLQKIIPLAGKANITCLYGMTENLMVSFQDGREKVFYKGKGDLAGKAFPGVKISFDEDNEICVESEQMFTRYWMQSLHRGCHKTGDLGRYDTDGNLVLTGRKKEMIIRRNFNIYPGLYEPTINRIDGVTEAAMIGMYDASREDEDVILVVEGKESLTATGILAKLKSGEYSIDKEAWPDKVIFMKLPRMGRQRKVNRKLLQEQLYHRK